MKKKEEVLFKEEQKFGSSGLYAAMGVIYMIPISIYSYAMYQQFILGIPWGDKPMSDNGLILTFVLVIFVLIVASALLFGSQLSTLVNYNQIKVTFKPFINKPIIYNKEDIRSYEIREYKPIREYGGWGIKQGKKSVGKAYNVRGNIGLQLVLSNGKKVLIGTQRSSALHRAMRKMMEKSKNE